MQPKRFESTPEFAQFKAVMRRVLAVPKSELDKLVARAEKQSQRRGDPNAPGRNTQDEGERAPDYFIDGDRFLNIEPIGKQARLIQSIRCLGRNICLYSQDGIPPNPRLRTVGYLRSVD